MKKFLNFLFFAFFIAVAAAIFFKIGQDIKDTRAKSVKENNRTEITAKSGSKLEKYLYELYKKIKFKLKHPKRKRVLSKKEKEILKAQNEPLAKCFKATKSKWGDKIYIRIFKKERQLEVWIKPRRYKKYRLLKVYKICYFSGKLGPKLKEGDYQAPEGFYRVYKKSLNPHSRYHLSFNLGFPNAYDRAHGRTGSYLMVHGKCVSAGCYAMGDKNIEEIYKLTKKALYAGEPYVPVHIYPFRMDKNTLFKYKSSKWYNFWLNLKEGYDYFEKRHIPAKIEVKNKRYILLQNT